MTLLEVFSFIFWFFILIAMIDIYKKWKLSHFNTMIFTILWILFIFISLDNYRLITWLKNIFWVQRWIDVLIYWAIFFIFYSIINQIRFNDKISEDLTKTIRNLSLDNVKINNNDLIFLQWDSLWIWDIKKWDFIFLIRSYNEWKVIKDTIKNLVDNWFKNILLIDDWSQDNTFSEIKNFMSNNSFIYLKHNLNRWAWAALETGFQFIRLNKEKFKNIKYLITFDADWQHDIKDIYNFWKEIINNKYEVILWSRFIEKTNTNVPFIRKLILIWWKIFTFLISWIYLTDAHNWYRLFNISTISKIKLTIDWMAYASELIDQIKINRFNFKEVPVNIIYTDYSLWKWQKSSNAINIVVKMIWMKFFK